MRFLSAKTGCKLFVHGVEYALNPVEYPNVNIHDILAGEYGYIYRAIRESTHVQEAHFEAEKIPGFPVRVSDLESIPDGSKLLIMRVGGLGDMIMLTPVLKYIREKISEDIEITLCTFKYAHELFRGNAVINNVISSPIRLSHLLEYDYYIEFYNERDEQIFSKLNMTDYYFKSINVDYETLGDTYKKPYLPESIADSSEITCIFDKLRHDKNRAIALVSMFSSDRTRDFPCGHFEQLINYFPDVLFVVPYKNTDAFKGRFDGILNKNVIFLDTSRSVKEYLTAIYCSDLVISPDSSAYHIAAAFEKPAVALFGSINPERRVCYYPTVVPLSGQYQGEFCQSPCGVSNAKWIKLDDTTGQEILRRKLYDPDRGCPEAMRNDTEYSPCLMAISHEEFHQTFRDVLERVSDHATQNTSGDELSAAQKGSGKSKIAVGRKAKMAKNKKVSISACMIVKNEEKLLPQCLESIRDVVDEIIVVDTGSTDRTIEIAEEFGATVYHHAWEDDFSKHRNQSISYATGDWILIIDADEKLQHKSGSLIRKAVRESTSPMIAVMVRNFMEKGRVTSGGLSVRLFKNGLDVHYTGIVHNQIQIIAPPAYYPVVLLHYGYDLDEENLCKKRERSLKLLLKQAEMFPNCNITHHHLAVTYNANGDCENAALSAQKAIDLLKDAEATGISWTYFILCYALYRIGRIDEAMIKAGEGLEKFPKSIDLHHLMAVLSAEKRDFEGVLPHARKYFELKQEYEANPSEFSLDVYEMDQKETDVYQAMGYAHYYHGDKEKALESFLDAEKTMFQNRGSKLGLIGKFYFSQEEYDNALHFFKAIGCDEAKFDQNLLFASQCLEKLERHAEAAAFYDTIQQSYPNELEPAFQKGTYMLRRKDFEGAVKAFELAHELNSQHVNTLVNWGYALTLLNERELAEEKYLLVLEINSDEPNANLNLGFLYYQIGNYDQSAPYLEKTLQNDPEHIYVNLALSHIFVKAGEIEKAVSLCEQLLQKLDLPANHKLESIKDLSLLYYVISKNLLFRGDLASHKIAYEIGNLLVPDDPTPLLELAEEAFRLSETGDGKKMLDFIYAAYPFLAQTNMSQAPAKTE